MKISIITVCYNSSKFIRDCLNSVLDQSYKDYEYLIVDGGSTDGTIEIIEEYQEKFGANLKWISEPDNGLYDAMNKGIKLATGDIIGILNSDDFLSNNEIISKVVLEFSDDIDAIYGNITFVHPNNLNKPVRYYSGKHFRKWMFRFGIMPPHASVYIRSNIFNRFGKYKTNFKVSADFELLIRFFYVNKLKMKYLNLDMVRMRTGGISTGSMNGKLQINKDSVRACKENGVYSNMLFMIIKYIIKYISKC